MIKSTLTAIAALALLAPAAIAADRSSARTWSEKTMEQPMNTALPGASGALHEHYRGDNAKAVPPAKVRELRQLAIAAGQSSRSEPGQDSAAQLSDSEKKLIESSREAFFARVRERLGR